MLCVIAKVESYVVGIPAGQVIEMLPLPAISPLPGQQSPIMGACTWREKWRPVVSMRAAFDCPTSAQELDDLSSQLAQRKKDHINWIAELESSVRQQRPFTLATDPHKCAFGRWFDSFETENLDLAAHVRLFDDPHRAIHGLAHRVVNLCNEGRTDQALQVIDAARTTTLARLLELFDATPAVARAASRQIGVVLATASEHIILAVDSVRSLYELEVSPVDSSGPLPPSQLGVVALAKLEGEGAVLILDPEAIVPEDAVAT